MLKSILCCMRCSLANVGDAWLSIRTEVCELGAVGSTGANGPRTNAERVDDMLAVASRQGASR